MDLGRRVGVEVEGGEGGEGGEGDIAGERSGGGIVADVDFRSSAKGAWQTATTWPSVCRIPCCSWCPRSLSR